MMLWGALLVATGLAAWLAHRVWGRGGGAATALLMATSPALRHYVGTIQYELVAAAGLLVVLFLAVRAADSSRTSAMLLAAASAGLAGGFLALTREVFLGVLPIIAAWVALRQWPHAGMRLALASSLAFLLLASVPIAMWSVAQLRTHGETVLISDKGPVTFALGNNPLASGTYNVDRTVEPMGVQFFVAMPSTAARLLVRKALYFWGVLRDGWNVPRPAALWIYRASAGVVPLEALLPLARGGWLLIGFVVGLVFLSRRGLLATWWIVPAVPLALLFAHVITLSSHRFAVPILPLVFVTISGPLIAAFHRVLAWTKSAWWRTAALTAAVALGIALQWVPVPVRVRYQAADSDAMNEINRVDPVLQRTVRFVGADGGRRAAMILADEYWPAGNVRLTIRARRGAAHASGSDMAVARATIVALDGKVACAEDIPLGILHEDRFADVWIHCNLKSDGPVTLIVETMGVIDLAFADVTLWWAS